MSFTGKTTYSAGTGFPELVDDVSDVVSLVAPAETPLLDEIGDGLRACVTTRHEWLEDQMLDNTGTINQVGLDDTNHATAILPVTGASRFQAGDLVRVVGSRELLRVVQVDLTDDLLQVVRGYADSVAGAIQHGMKLVIMANPAGEGAEAPTPRFTVRKREGNTTQIFARQVKLSGSELAVRHAGVEDELDYQKQMRLRELLRELENSLINGTEAAGDENTPRMLGGIISRIKSNVMTPGTGGMPAGATLTEALLNAAIRQVWEVSGAQVNLIVVGGAQKRALNQFASAQRVFTAGAEVYKNLVSAYESDYGRARIVLSRYVPSDTVLLLEAGRLSVLPLAGRSFHYKALASTGDYVAGELIGEYTLEMRNEACHGMLTGLGS